MARAKPLPFFLHGGAAMAAILGLLLGPAPSATAAEVGGSVCPSGCVPYHTYPDAFSTVPASLPALATSVGGQTPRLFDAQGAELGLSPAGTTLAGAQVWQPAGPLVAGRGYTWRYTPNGCDTTDSGVRGFVATSAAPLPSKVGTLAVSVVHLQYDVGSLVSARVDLQPADELKPYLGATQLKVYIDGQPVDERLPFALSAGCDGFRPDQVTCQRLVAPGAHQVRIAAVLPGMPQVLSSTEIAVPLDCGQPLFSNKQLLANETGVRQALVAGSSSDAQPSGSSSSSSSGCGTAPGQRANGLLVAGAAATVAMFFRRRQARLR